MLGRKHISGGIYNLKAINKQERRITKKNTSGKIQKFIYKQKHENSNEFLFPEIRKMKYLFDFMRILSDEEENELKTIL